MHLRRPPTVGHRRSARCARRASVGHHHGRASGGHHRGGGSGGHHRERASDRSTFDRARGCADAHARHLRSRRRETGRGRCQRLRTRMPVVLPLELSRGRRHGSRSAHHGSAGKSTRGTDAGRPRSRHHRSRRSTRRSTACAGKARFADGVRGPEKAKRVTSGVGGGGVRSRGSFTKVSARAFATATAATSRERGTSETRVSSLVRSRGSGKRTRHRIVSAACRFADDGAAGPSRTRRASGYAGLYAPLGALYCPCAPGGWP